MKLFYKDWTAISTSTPSGFSWPSTCKARNYHCLSSCCKYQRREKAESDTGLITSRFTWNMCLPQVKQKALQIQIPQDKHPTTSHREGSTEALPDCGQWGLFSPKHCPRSTFMVGGAQSTTPFWSTRNVPAQKNRRNFPKNGKTRVSLNGFLLATWKISSKINLGKHSLWSITVLKSQRLPEIPNYHRNKGRQTPWLSKPDNSALDE